MYRQKARINSKGIDGSARLTAGCVFQWVNCFFQLFVPVFLVISMGIWKLIMYFGHILPVREIQAFLRPSRVGQFVINGKWNVRSGNIFGWKSVPYDSFQF
jgi:hypothetical protein